MIMSFEETDAKKLMEEVKLGRRITEQNIIKMLYSMLCAMRFFHSTNLMHRDIKPANLLIDKDFNVKLCDFGTSRELPESMT